MSVGEKVRELRKRSGMTLHEFGAKVGVSHTAINKIEVGRNKPSMVVQRAIREHFDLPEDFFLEDAVSKLDYKGLNLYDGSKFKQSFIDTLSKEYDFSEFELAEVMYNLLDTLRVYETDDVDVSMRYGVLKILTGLLLKPKEKND